MTGGALNGQSKGKQKAWDIRNSHRKVSNETPTVQDDMINLKDEEKTRKASKKCKYFNAEEGCRAGENCQFVHVKKMKNNETTAEPRDIEKSSTTKLCRYFNTKEGCRSGDDCQFRHIKKEILKENEENTVEKVNPKIKICKYFKTKEGCRAGESCPFRHVKKEKNQESTAARSKEIEENSKPEANEPVEKKIIQPPQSQRRGPVIPVKITLKANQEGTDEQKAAFSAEIAYFKRRYRHCQIDIQEDQSTVISFKYAITEPDWVFDVKTIYFTYLMRETYPISPPIVTLPEQKNRALPDILLQHMQRTISAAIEMKYKLFAERNAYEISGKNFLYWTDRNISQLFLEGLRQQKLVLEAEAAGITLVTRKVQEVKISPENDEPRSSTQLERDEESEEEEDSEEEEEDEEESPENGTNKIETPSGMEGREVQHEFPINLSLVWKNESQNIASILPKALPVQVRCVRCREEKIHNLPVNRLREFRCPKCSVAQTVRTRSEIIHENNSILAKFDCRGCRPVDLILLDAQLKFACLNCNKEDEVQKINYGLAHRSFCRSCNKRCEFVIIVARFGGDFSKCNLPANLSSALPKPKQPKKVVEGATIIPGQPLPENGTCKHYKKSYRWFRFPCCGRAFPCDSCHEEAKLGHEMKNANRMICGHCSSEQPFVANKPCSKCRENMTRAKSRFWEGGKGCRDQIKMSRNETHKYSNGKKKTVTKK